MKTKEVDEEIKIPAGLEFRLEKLINKLADTEKQSKRKSRRVRWWIGSAAATVLLLFSTGLLLKPEFNSFSSSRVDQTIENPEIAYLEVQKALELVSRNFNKGLSQLDVVASEIEKSNYILNKTLKQ
jgi:hypothetical protein